jgi:glucose/mannose transport system permease protein
MGRLMRKQTQPRVMWPLPLVALLFAMPLLAMLATSLKPLEEIRRGSLFLLPHHPTLAPWGRAWANTCIGGLCHGISVGMVNSVLIVVPALVLSLLLGSITGFALSLRQTRRTNLLFAALLIGLFIPAQVVLFPMIVTLRKAGLFGTRIGLIAVDVIYGLPFLTLLFRNFFISVPRELLNAARIDGAGFADIFLRVMFPLSRPVWAVALILQFTFLWNEFLYGLTFSVSGNEPVSVALNILFGLQLGVPQYNVNMAAATIAALPTILLYLIGSRLLVSGFAARPFHG